MYRIKHLLHTLLDVENYLQEIPHEDDDGNLSEAGQLYDDVLRAIVTTSQILVCDIEIQERKSQEKEEDESTQSGP